MVTQQPEPIREPAPYITFGIFDRATGAYKRTNSCRADSLPAQLDFATEEWHEGEWREHSRIVNGKPQQFKAPTPQITAWSVKEEAARRILARYPLGKQNTIMLRGGNERETMRIFIEAVIAASHRIEAMSPIPADYASDKYWI